MSLTRQFIEDAEKESEKETGISVSELNVKDTGCQEGSTTRDKEAIKALKLLFEDFEDRLQYQNEVLDESASEDGEEQGEPPQETTVHSAIFPSCDEAREFLPCKEPQLYLCDDWIQPMAVLSRPHELTARGKVRANLAKNCLIVTLMSLELGYGSILERYQQERSSSPILGAVSLTEEDVFVRLNEPLEMEYRPEATPAAMPPPTRLSGSNPELLVHNVGTEGAKDANLKMYHVMSVKQTLREDLAEHAYQFSCRAADWTRSDFRSVPMQFEPLELHVVDALGQQEVPDYFQQPAKAITEDVSVMRGPHALEWIYAVREEIESFKRLGVYEEVPKGSATSTPLPARLILVTKPNIHGGPARKKARILICGNFQEVHPDEFMASKTPSYPALRMALSVASHMGWPIECWDVSTVFLYARLFGDRDTEPGGNETFMRPPKILVETKVVEEGVVWKINKALYVTPSVA